MMLYHYTKLSKALVHILPSMRLRFSPLVGMNDPVENLCHYSNFEDSIFQYGCLSDIIRAEKIQKQWSALCFCTTKEKNGERIGGDSLQRMWSMYASEHNDTYKGVCNGVCLAIDRDKLVRENREAIKKYEILDEAMSYSNYALKRVPMLLMGTAPGKSEFIDPLDVSKKSLGTDIKNLFFTKNEDWAGESEYRFLVHSEDECEKFLSIKDSLEYVVLGVGFPKSELPKVKRLVKEKPIYAMNMDIHGNLERDPLPDGFVDGVANTTKATKKWEKGLIQRMFC